MRRRIVGWLEQDAHTKWGRKYLFWQRGELKKAKRLTVKRERRDGRQEIEQQLRPEDSNPD